jgi:hypothetical protein
VASAEKLKEISPHQFEWWAVDLVNARPAKDHKKGADTGIDGYINFFDRSGFARGGERKSNRDKSSPSDDGPSR